LFTSWQDSNAQQVDTTGNLVVNTPQGGPSSWTNGVYQSQLTCWAGGQPGYCGPNPIVRPGNNINFSYGQTDLYQVQAISAVLPSATGLRVNGFNFGFTAKNGNGWDDGRVDQLSAYVKFFDKQGSVVDSNVYNLTYKFDWTAFNFSKDFQTPLVADSLSTVRYGFIGRDNNFWAGPYGPEVNSINFQLKYSVDPCASNPMYSATCPGYLDALNKLVPQQPQATTTTTIAPSIEAAPAPQVQIQQTTQTSTSAVANPTVVQPVVIQQASSQASTPSQLQLALSIVSRNQERDKQLQQAAVQQALDIAQQAGDRALQVAQQVAQQQSQQSQQQDLAVFNTAVQQVQQQQAVQFATQSPQQQQQTRQTSTQTDQVQQTISAVTSVQTTQQQQQQFASLAPAQQIVVQQQTVVQQSATQLLEPQPQQQVQQTSIQTATAAPATLIVTKPSQQEPATQPVLQPVLQPPQVIPTAPVVQQVYKPAVAEVLQTQPPLLEQAQQQQQVVLQKYKEPDTPQPIAQPLQDRTNPISDLFYGLAFTPSTTSSMQELRKDVANNELAGGISLDRLSTQPIGYQQYMALALQDAKFYQPREIYNRQTTVDNQRALRQLSSDRLHQQMVNEQYK